ncbi:YdcF family protein [Mycobacterium sp. pV006]|uniref:YdcF family protein n=1 Tax=Mycobacterium sp. pV006 TaxID=3238983 RepID=UPI00351AB6AE
MIIVGCVLVAAFTNLAIAGQLLIANTPDDDVSSADAVVVLGGEHDGREVFGILLAQRLQASTVVLSDPYPTSDSLMRSLCSGSVVETEVLCVRPDPPTTRGEAIAARDLATRHGWRRIVVVSWRFHLRRAELIFGQCFSRLPGSVAYVGVPDRRQLPFAVWQQIFLYQFAAMAKAMIQGPCSDVT